MEMQILFFKSHVISWDYQKQIYLLLRHLKKGFQHVSF